MKNFNFKINGKEYQTAVEQTSETEIQVTVNGKTFTAEVEKAAAAPVKVAAPKAAPAPAAAAAPSAPKAPSAGATVVSSPLPGVIVSVAVKAGQAVKAGDLLLTLEAMKMENSVLAEADGTVKNILVAAGQTVQSGDALVEME